MYSTLLGATGKERPNGKDESDGNGIAVLDTAVHEGVVFARLIAICGSTLATDFPTAKAYQQLSSGMRDGFVTLLGERVLPNINFGLVSSTYLGGKDDDTATGVAFGNGSVYVTGSTDSGDFPIRNPFRPDQLGADAFVTRFAAPGVESLEYSTYLGGQGDDFGKAIAVDSAGRAYVAGTSNAKTFPLVNAFDSTSTLTDAFVTVFAADGKSLSYSTFLGGSGSEEVGGIALDALRNAYVIGSTTSSDFPTVVPLQASLKGNSDAFISVIKLKSPALIFSTFLGGLGKETGGGIAVDNTDRVYVTGSTGSTDFRTSNALQANNHGGDDVFVAKMGNLFGAGLTGSWGELNQSCLDVDCHLTGRFTVENVGVLAARNSILRFYLSSDETLDENDQLLQEVYVGSVRDGRSKPRALDVHLTGSASGMFVIAFVDADNAIEEPNEDNNVIVSPAIP